MLIRQKSGFYSCTLAEEMFKIYSDENAVSMINIYELLKKYIHQGFSLESLSLVTQLSVDTLAKMIDDPTYLPKD